MKKHNLFLLLIVLIFCSGCSHITETAKIIWGSSTKALENARVDALDKTYRCSLNDCYDAVLSLARKEKTHLERVQDIEEAENIEEEEEEETGLLFGNNSEEVDDANAEGYFDIFINNRAKRHIVVMGISGNIKTTEVGIFFSQPSLTTVKLEVSSLSGNAKRNIAQFVFDELDSRFSPAQ